MTLSHVAIGIAGVVAYTGIAGVMWRFIRPARAMYEWEWWLGGFVGFAVAFIPAAVLVFDGEIGEGVDTFSPAAAIWWPITMAVFLPLALSIVLLRVLLLPLRAVFRITAGPSA